VLCKSFLQPGDKLFLRIGDPRQGCPGVRMQTHCESAFQFRVTVDAFASVDYTPILPERQPTVAVIPDDPVVWKAVLPMLRRGGDPFRLIVKSEDRCGNPSDRFDGTLRLRPNRPIPGLPETVTFARGAFSAILPDLCIAEPGDYEVTVLDGGTELCPSKPPRIREGAELLQFWPDMHGQSGESIGTGTAREYFLFARDKSFVDMSGHQANDFQITDAF
jgi:hypothetical protein